MCLERQQDRDDLGSREAAPAVRTGVAPQALDRDAPHRGRMPTWHIRRCLAGDLDIRHVMRIRDARQERSQLGADRGQAGVSCTCKSPAVLFGVAFP